jgi:hypothetical protein
MNAIEQAMLSETYARGFALREIVALLISIEARAAAPSTDIFRKMSEALDDRLDELPPGISDLKDKVHAEIDWIIGCARAFHDLQKP